MRNVNNRNIHYAVTLSGIEYMRDERKAEAESRGEGGLFVLYLESYILDDEEKARTKNAAFLQEVGQGVGAQ